MSTNGEQRTDRLWIRARIALRQRFSLRADKADDADIDQSLRAGVEMRGTNLWVLMCAILIASIGLNVNSTAVIIGAMLISPLMGPIMGIGYGVGIDDLQLVRNAFKNLGIATLIGLLASAAYFAASPLHTIQSELLARTSPNIWDVLIALFGGLAGIVAATRKEKSNVVPGVAIATALMPPLCTAGFGLATANWPFFFGALYLFTINCVFIAAASAAIVSAFHLPHKRFIDQRAALRVHLLLGIAVVCTVLPSLYLAYRLVQEEIFNTKATQFVHDHLGFTRSHVVDLRIDPKEKRIEATLIGEVVPDDAIANATAQLAKAGLPGAELKVYQTGDQRIDVTALKTTLLGDMYRHIQGNSEQKDKTIEQLRNEISSLQSERQRFSDVPDELHALFPSIQRMLLADSPQWTAGSGWDNKRIVMVSLQSTKALSKAERAQIEQWLRLRVKSDAVTLDVKVEK